MSLHVHSFGPADGRPLVALHGVSGHGARWRNLAQRQLPRGRVHGVDLRGHGRSPWTPPWSLEQHVADVVATMDSLGLEQVDLLGHSYGGAVALHMVRLAADRVRRLVLLDPAIGLDPSTVLEFAQQPARVFADLAEARDAQKHDWPDTPEAVEDELAEHLEAHPDGGLRFRYCVPAVATAWSEMARPAVLPPAGMPTLLVPALRADFVRQEFVGALRDRLGSSLLVRGVDCGHMVYLERPDEVGALLTEFLSG